MATPTVAPAQLCACGSVWQDSHINRGPIALVAPCAACNEPMTPDHDIIERLFVAPGPIVRVLEHLHAECAQPSTDSAIDVTVIGRPSTDIHLFRWDRGWCLEGIRGKTDDVVFDEYHSSRTCGERSLRTRIAQAKGGTRKVAA